MVLQKADHVVKTMLSDTILALCRNTLPYEGEVLVEGLLGITLDNKEIFLVNINETIQREGYKRKPPVSGGEKLAKKRKTDSELSDDSSSQDEDSDSQKRNGAKRKKRKRRRSKDKEKSVGEEHTEEDIQEDETSAFNPDASDQEVSRDSSQRLSRGDEGDDSRLDMEQDSHEKETAEDRLHPRRIKREENEEDIVFVKEEVQDSAYGRSPGGPFAMPSSSQTGDSSQMFGQGDPVALGQLQELALQLSGDNRSMVRD